MATKRPSLARKCTEKSYHVLVNEEIQARLKQVKLIMHKGIDKCNEEELKILHESPEMVTEIQKRAAKQESVKERKKEVYDLPEVLLEKANALANAIREANFAVVYTGAGVSTAASIPDYRGPNGIWTRLSKGESIKSCNISDADPTLTHMSIQKLYEKNYQVCTGIFELANMQVSTGKYGPFFANQHSMETYNKLLMNVTSFVHMVKHVVSQNCDGLHIRSGLPSHALSEVHGNMYLEVCTECSPERKYFRVFDVTEKTALRRHLTGRFCHYCGKKLRDTIVHFGEKGCLEWPLNWQGAIDAGKTTDCIICLGSSLKVLKRYDLLWGMKRTKAKRPKLYIVNLQWTPKDPLATLKIHGRCDEVMKLVMDKLGLGIPEYKRSNDPLFRLFTPLRDHEWNTKTTKDLARLGGSTAMNGIESVQNHEATIGIIHTVKEGKLDEECETEIVGAGWYGKGCAKLRKPKKRRKLK